MKPVLQALVLAEHVYQDVSGKKVIAGTFNRVRFTKKPLSQHVKTPEGGTGVIIPGGMQGGSPYAYLSLTDVCDQTELTLQFVNLTSNKTLLGKKVVVNVSDRLATVELVLPLPALPIDEPGTYAFEVVCEGDILGSYRIAATEFDPTPPEQQE